MVSQNAGGTPQLLSLRGQGTVSFTVPANANVVVVSGFAATNAVRVQNTYTATLSITGIGALSRTKYGSRGGSSGHQYNSTFAFPFDEQFAVSVSAGQQLQATLSVPDATVMDARVILTYYKL